MPLQIINPHPRGDDSYIASIRQRRMPDPVFFNYRIYVIFHHIPQQMFFFDDALLGCQYNHILRVFD